jgi:lipopolysaccharide transport system ATP-binding protein
MHVRLGFSVAAHLEPDILVVDEVLAVGDQGFQKKAINKLEDVSKNEGRTVLFVSHNLKAIEKFCTTTLLLDSGKIKKIGKTNEIIQFYTESFNRINFNQNELFFKRQKEKKIQVLRLSVLNENFETTNFLDRTKNFILSLDYILTFPSKDFKINLSLNTHGSENGVQHNTTVFQWSEQHYRKFNLDNEDVFKNPGTYNVKVTIPSNILNSGKYRYAILIEYAETWYDKLDGLIFELYDSGSSHTLKTGRSAGLIAMPLDWNEKKIS